MTLNRVWLVVTVPVFIIGVVTIVKLALGLVRFTRDTIVASLPVIPQQTLVLPSDDHYSIFMQGRLGERGFGDFRFSVAAESSKKEVRVTPVFARTSATSLDGTVRVELFAFSAPAGRHVIRTTGIDPARDYGENRVVIAYQRRAQLVARIVALVLTGALTVASLVASGLLIARPR